MCGYFLFGSNPNRKTWNQLFQNILLIFLDLFDTIKKKDQAKYCANNKNNKLNSVNIT